MTSYPTNPIEWQLWIDKHLGISVTEAKLLMDSDSFPTEELEIAWQREFTVANGYVSDFIPALVRNKLGLLRWTYLGEAEPNWRESD
ncbi:MAG: hypothetical protein ACFFED_18585 [Candidatus Thorarchaeota archaeon]